MPILQLNYNCPFRKETVATKDHDSVYHLTENFLPCIKNDCLAWNYEEENCKLMRSKNKD